MARLSQLFAVLSALWYLLASCWAEKIDLRRNVQERKVGTGARPEYRFLPPVQASHGGPEDELELLDIALLASVDGAFHALNRTSGQILWSMGTTSSSSSPTALSPLVRTQHVERDTYDEDREHHELYIIEPQSGDIYILTSPDAPLQRLPFSVPQLVDMSPFSFSGDQENRVFVGKKETSLLLMELETGRLKGTLNSTCPWDPFGDFDNVQSKAEFDLDELEERRVLKGKSVSTEVLIGRTDYYVSIHTRPHNPSDPKPPVQNLIFSTYGPNNQDFEIQGTYRRSPDDIYIQPLPNGEVMSFRTLSSDWSEYRALWYNEFKRPIVAVFDVLQSPKRQHPVILLQPKPRLKDFAPNYDFAANFGGNPSWSNIDTTYVGLVKDNDALFAMSPEHFPLVVFSQENYIPKSRRNKKLSTIDAPLESDDDMILSDLPSDIDGVTRVRKELEKCSNGNWDRSCYVGKRPVVAAGQSRLSRLLPGRLVPEDVSQLREATREDAFELQTEYVSSRSTNDGNFSQDPQSPEGAPTELIDSYTRILSGGVIAFTLSAIGLWYSNRKAKEKYVGNEDLTNHQNAMERRVPPNPTRNDNQKEARNVGFSAPAEPEAFLRRQEDGTGISNPEVFRKDTNDSPSPFKPNNPDAAEDIYTSESLRAAEGHDDMEGDDDSDREGDNLVNPGKRKGTRRRKRGKKHRGMANVIVENLALDNKNSKKEGNRQENVTESATTPIVTSPNPQLIVTDEVLGYGSHGTVVLKGSLQGRAVAVKRLLNDFVTLASREVDVLQESDDHPNVIRYYYKEAHANFLYIALELCPASLADMIERPDLHREISNAFEPKRALQQITSGLRHLHDLKIVHRDIKPQNILISSARCGTGVTAGHRMLISDFGLCKRLEVDQTSFLPTAYGVMAAGTAGWRAPEILRGEVKLDDMGTADGSTQSQSSRGSTGTVVNGRAQNGKATRLTKSVDIFALGCLFYYVLTNGGHPYGDRYEREVNILKDAKSLSTLETFGEEGLEAIDLITRMLDPEAQKRPSTSSILTQPFFWTSVRRLAFLQDASDRFEIMCRDPRDADLLELEKDAYNVVGNDWQSRLDKVFLENLGKFRKYDEKSVQDLLRALRNKKHHYQDLPDSVKRQLGPIPEGFLSYFTRRFPHLVLHVHSVVSRTNMRYESVFKSYFELPD